MKDQLLKNLQTATVPASIILQADFTIGIFNASTFPNIGQLIFNRGDMPCLVLDSHASVTNMLEGTVQLPGTEAPVFAGLPYVRMVNQDGGYEATSLTLPHRLGSGYLAKNKMAMLGGNRYDKQLLGVALLSDELAAWGVVCPDEWKSQGGEVGRWALGGGECDLGAGRRHFDGSGAAREQIP
jgi:hypothetical protein